MRRTSHRPCMPVVNAIQRNIRYDTCAWLHAKLLTRLVNQPHQGPRDLYTKGLKGARS